MNLVLTSLPKKQTRTVKEERKLHGMKIDGKVCNKMVAYSIQ